MVERSGKRGERENEIHARLLEHGSRSAATTMYTLGCFSFLYKALQGGRVKGKECSQENCAFYIIP